MNVLLLANYLPDGQESMQRFSAMLACGLSAAGHQVRVCRPQARAGTWARSAECSKLLGYVDKLACFPFTLREAVRWADVVHICDHSNAFYTPWRCKQPFVVTCHDVLAIRSAAGAAAQHQTRWTGRQLQRMIVSGLRRAQQIACVSRATYDELRQQARVRADAASIVPNGVGPDWFPMHMPDAEARTRALGVPANAAFLLHVGHNHWYKNRAGVLRLMAALRQRGSSHLLVLAGKAMNPEMRAYATRAGLSRSIVEVGSVSDHDLRALYTRAAALLFPSLHEGFGWPILEAQACGCPVVTSNRAPMTEVGGDAAIYVDPEDPVRSADVVADALPVLGSLRSPGLRNAARFTVDRMIDGYVELYRKVAA